MTIDEALSAMSRTDELNDGTEERAVIVEALHRKLLQDPEDFWSEFLEVCDGLRDDPMRELAERLIREGKTTFADARAALDSYHSVAPKQ